MIARHWFWHHYARMRASERANGQASDDDDNDDEDVFPFGFRRKKKINKVYMGNIDGILSVLSPPKLSIFEKKTEKNK